jgi:ATP-dependent HslUV protease ATP-binding subunit HslU
MDLTPKQIVHELDKYIIGQSEAKKAVAIALRNRYRRSQLSPELQDEITPKNIIMRGPTGVGKTEIARRLAKLVKAPFLKVEATKYTEVGYVGRDVESMIRDLAECAIRLVKEEKTAEVSYKATAIAERKVAKALAEIKKEEKGETAQAVFEQQLVDDIHAGKYDSTLIEIEVEDVPKPMELSATSGAAIDLGSIFSGMGLHKKKKRKVTVKEALNCIIAEEADKLIDNDAVTAEALRRCENDGIIFIDEIDKIAGSKGSNGADVSREGVQRDILPIVEGCTVMTKYGPVKTDYILFIAAGAFFVSKVEDIIPELQGRFPILVDLKSLTKEDFVKILTQPQNAITTQYCNLLAVDNIDLHFTPDAIEKIAEMSVLSNEQVEDIGARRLHSVMEYLLEDISFNAGGNDYPVITVEINAKYVEEHLEGMNEGRDGKKRVTIGFGQANQEIKNTEEN